MNRNDLQRLSEVRLREAKALLDLGLNDGAYYLAGYAVECALKSCIAKKTRRHDFPDKKRVLSSHTHELNPLVDLAGLADAHRERGKSDPVFQENWLIVQSWSETSRYERHGAESAQVLIEAITNRSHGIIGWIKRHW